MKPETVVALGVLGAGAFLLWPTIAPELAAIVPLPTTAGAIDPYTGQPIDPAITPAQQVALDQIRATETLQAGNAPVVPPAPFFGTAQGVGVLDTALVSGAGLADAAIFGAASVVGGIVTLGVAAAIAFFSYEYLQQRASIQTNRVRDAWEFQFVALHDALGIRPLPYVTGSGGRGTQEMAEVIFMFDHDSSQRLWHAVQGTQNETQYKIAARAVEIFLGEHGVPVTNP